MENVREKIAKLLALGDSPNENEARAALLKARELMAEYKLSPEEFEKRTDAKVVKRTIGIFCTKMTDQWASRLNALIARHYCCGSYRHRQKKGDRTVELGLIGFEEDWEICAHIVRYAYECVKSRCKEITAKAKRYGATGKEIRQACNAYGWGFCAGLSDAYDAQEREHQEWGLVMVVPRQVTEVIQSMGKGSVFSTASIQPNHDSYLRMGYADGQKFDPGARIPESERMKALA